MTGIPQARLLVVVLQQVGVAQAHQIGAVQVRPMLDQARRTDTRSQGRASKVIVTSYSSPSAKDGRRTVRE
jgi:hypothetical protein